MRVRFTVLLVAGAVLASGCSQTVMKSEPRNGTLAVGQSVLVDDGSCPAGQVKKVWRGRKGSGYGRLRECVDAPKG